MAAQAHKRELTGTKVLLVFVAFFAVIAGVNAIMLRAATSTFGGVEVDGAYKHGLMFNKDIAAAANQDARHWHVDASLLRGAGTTAQISVIVRGANGAILPAIGVTARLIHPADAKRDHRVTLREVSAGDFKGETDAAPGQWDLLIEASRADEVLFRSRSRLTLR